MPEAGELRLRGVLAEVVRGLPALAVGQERQFTAAEREYLAFYGLDFPGQRHAFGYVQGAGWRLATQVFRPPAAVGTVVLAHGYYDHAGVLRQAIGALLAASFEVVVYDQPGHGLSDGRRAWIDDFHVYEEVLAEVVRLAVDEWRLTVPVHLVGHSMGAAAAIGGLLRGRPELGGVERVVLVAPLVRSAHWRLSGAGDWLAGDWLEEVDRVFRNNSGDREFRAFVKADPLQPRSLPMGFSRAHREWEAGLAGVGPCGRRLLILQGERDNVVDGDFNLAFLERHFGQVEICRYARGGHQLFNEVEPLRRQVFADLCGYLLRLP